MTAILPSLPDIASWQIFALIITSFLGSFLTAALSIGGGTLMITVMSLVLPAPAVVPVHGLVQLGSNAGRVAILRHHISWRIVLWFAAGGIVGAGIGAMFVRDLPADMLRLGIALFILYAVWGPKPTSFGDGRTGYIIGGVITSFLTMFIGASGPFLVAIVNRANLDRLGVTATSAMCMVFKHGVKIVLFGVLGFAFAEWLLFISILIVVGLAGTWVGTRVLHKLPEKSFRTGLNLMLTIMALYLIFASLRGLMTT